MADEPAPPPGLAPAKSVAIGNRLTSAVSGFLSARTSRRGFLIRSALVGSAFAVAGCGYGTKKGPAYQRLTDCAPNSMCRGDGYTEFCCSINGGYNQCPGDSIPAGWWRADSSHWCHGGSRYYVDCNQVSGTPAQECRCGPSCDNRRVYCNYFRYGQCNSHVAVGPIACRLSYCEPPPLAELGCSPNLLVDNSTAGHITGCLLTGPPAPPPPPPPPPPTTKPPTTTSSTTTTTKTTTTTSPPT